MHLVTGLGFVGLYLGLRSVIDPKWARRGLILMETYVMFNLILKIFFVFMFFEVV